MNSPIEDSKIMARYMGYEYFPHNQEGSIKAGWHKPEPLTKINSHRWYLCRKHRDIPYIWSWDRLMEVYLKLRKEDISTTANLVSGNREQFFINLSQWIISKNI